MIEREWIKGGHPFRLRCVRSAFGRSTHGQESPLFPLFLDCTWQVRSFPSLVHLFHLEIPRSLLNNLLVHLNSMKSFSSNYSIISIHRNLVRKTSFCKHLHFLLFQSGTFIFNNEKEKIKSNGMKKTVSLWSYLNRPEILRTFLNPFYEPNIAVLWPTVAPQSIVSQTLSNLHESRLFLPEPLA